ncbi:hypothetical protein OsI_23048 [Oryza sativa Indica Group]|uniref:Uncharacterized protein n=1 Tax=Oryza sativa subsp. indica TaxID=39946 RepID=B8B2S4_ORYSI|nr:hypothetical protein OsI_23048 [Oryza sativa Indica Group]
MTSPAAAAARPPPLARRRSPAARLPPPPPPRLLACRRAAPLARHTRPPSPLFSPLISRPPTASLFLSLSSVSYRSGSGVIGIDGLGHWSPRR